MVRRTLAAAIVIALSLWASPSVAGDLSWDWHEGVGVAVADVATDDTGLTVVVGTTQVGDQPFFLVAAFGPDGTRLWTDTFQPTPYQPSGALGTAVTMDREGRVYAVGFSWHCRYGCESGYWFIRAYTRGGALRWSRGAGSWQNPRQWKATGVDAWARGIVVSGYDYDDDVGPTDSWVRSYGFDGSLRWVRPVGIPGRSDLRYTADAIAVGGRGTVFVAGSLEPDVPLGTDHDQEPFIQKLTAGGEPGWTRVFREIGDLDNDAALTVDLRGEVIAVGGVLGNPIGWGLPAPHLAWLARLSLGGDLRWMRTWGVEHPQDVEDVSIAPSGRILTVGGIRTRDPSYALILRAHTAAGQLVSTRVVHPAGRSLVGNAISADASGMSIAGTFYRSTYLDPAVAGRVWRT